MAAVLTVDDLLTLPKEVEAEWSAVTEAIHRLKFTGPITINCHLGVPKTVQIPPPQIRLKD